MKKWIYLTLTIFFTMIMVGMIVDKAFSESSVGQKIVSILFLATAIAIPGKLFSIECKKEKQTNKELQNQHDRDIEILDFFEKPVEETISKIEENFSEEITENEKKQIIFDKIESIINLSYKDGIITEDEENRIIQFLQHYNLKTSNLPRHQHELLTKGLIIRDLLQGKQPDRVQVGDIPFNLMKNEKFIFGFAGMPVSEIKTVSEYQAGSQGFSFRVMKGVYYHTGGTKGKRIEKQIVKPLGYSDIVITNKHLYFQSNGNATRIKHEKIISVMPDADGVTVFRDGARQNPIYFQTSDAWFLGNVLKNAQNVD